MSAASLALTALTAVVTLSPLTAVVTEPEKVTLLPVPATWQPRNRRERRWFGRRLRKAVVA